MTISFWSIKLWVQNLIDLAMWKVLCSLTWVPGGKALGPKHSQASPCCVGNRWPWAAGNSKYSQGTRTPLPFPERQGSASVPFLSSWEACGQEENDATTIFLTRNRQRAGVINPGDSLQPELSQKQTCLALIWKMGILTFYLENYIDLLSTTSSES